MKSSLISACAAALLLSACGNKEFSPPAAPAKPKVEAAAPAPAGTMSAEDKLKAMDAAKASAKSAGGTKE